MLRFLQNAFFTSGCGAVYRANILNALPDSDLAKAYPNVFNPAGSKLIAGQRLLPGKLTRAVDANHIRIQQEVKMNGAFRIHIFAGEFATSQPILKKLDAFINSPGSFINVHRPAKGVHASTRDGQGMGALRYIEKEVAMQEQNPFFTFLTVFSDPHTEWSLEDLPLSLRTFRDQVSFPSHAVSPRIVNGNLTSVSRLSSGLLRRHL